MYTLLCEEIRDEKSGTRSLIGVFAPEGIKVSSVPFVLPKFGIFTVVEITDPTKQNHLFSVEIIDPSHKVIANLKDLKFSTNKPTGRRLYLSVNVSPFQIKAEGDYLIKVSTNDGLSSEAILHVVLSRPQEN